MIIDKFALAAMSTALGLHSLEDGRSVLAVLFFAVGLLNLFVAGGLTALKWERHP